MIGKMPVIKNKKAWRVSPWQKIVIFDCDDPIIESQTDLDQEPLPYTPRVLIWIQRPTGGPYLGNRLTKRDLLMDIATDFGFLDYKAAEYTARGVRSFGLVDSSGLLHLLEPRPA